LIDANKLKNVKRSTVTIGLAEHDKFPLVVLGTGFFVSSDALIMSAGHVLEECLKAKQHFRERYGKDLGLVASFAYTSKLERHIISVRIRKMTTLKMKHYDLDYVGPLDFDISVAQLEEEKSKPLAFLDLKPTRADLYQEVAICGYPQGGETFALLDNPSGLKLSPIIQFGRISRFMPYDDADIPYGIQTDIVGTGGSSGSPIVNMSGELLGIAQRVIPAEVLNSGSELQKDNEVSEFAKIGITYGLFNQYFPEMLRGARESLARA
jgi:Trypsin-like peptidase domain